MSYEITIWHTPSTFFLGPACSLVSSPQVVGLNAPFSVSCCATRASEHFMAPFRDTRHDKSHRSKNFPIRGYSTAKRFCVRSTGAEKSCCRFQSRTQTQHTSEFNSLTQIEMAPTSGAVAAACRLRTFRSVLRRRTGQSCVSVVVAARSRTTPVRDYVDQGRGNS